MGKQKQTNKAPQPKKPIVSWSRNTVTVTQEYTLKYLRQLEKKEHIMFERQVNVLQRLHVLLKDPEASSYLNFMFDELREIGRITQIHDSVYSPSYHGIRYNRWGYKVDIKGKIRQD